MTGQEERTRDLYAISLGIGPEETFQRTVQFEATGEGSVVTVRFDQ